jgi:hypothetical protein
LFFHFGTDNTHLAPEVKIELSFGYRNGSAFARISKGQQYQGREQFFSKKGQIALSHT